MNMSISNGIIVDSKNRIVIIKGEIIPFHPKMKGNNVTTINGISFIDGYELVKGEWKKTLKAIFYKYF